MISIKIYNIYKKYIISIRNDIKSIKTYLISIINI